MKRFRISLATVLTASLATLIVLVGAYSSSATANTPAPDLDCPEIPFRRFRVLPPDPHRFDGDNDGIGCES